jgi:hypothetical protein
MPLTSSLSSAGKIHTQERNRGKKTPFEKMVDTRRFSQDHP